MLVAINGIFLFLFFKYFFVLRKTVNVVFVENYPIERFAFFMFSQDSLVWPFSAVFQGKNKIVMVQNLGKKKKKKKF